MLRRLREPLHCRCCQLARGARIAKLVGAFPKESNVTVFHVQAGAHPVSTFRRCHDRGNGLERVSTDTAERVLHDLLLQGQLAVVGDVRECAAATAWVAVDSTPVG